MTKTEPDQTCAVCGGTWGEPWGVPKRGGGLSDRGYIDCPADCHDEAKWEALGGLVDWKNWLAQHVATLETQADTLLARIAELERDQMGFDEQIMTADQRIAELEKDRERLDWFERVRPDVSMDWKGIWYVSIGQGTREVTQFEGGTLRETIDAAREEKS